MKDKLVRYGKKSLMYSFFNKVVFVIGAVIIATILTIPALIILSK